MPEIFEYPIGIVLPPVHPGKTLSNELSARKLSAHALALKLRVPANRLSDIIREKRAISAETALRLGRYFGNGGEFWMHLQANYDLAIARQQFIKIIEQEVETS